MFSYRDGKRTKFVREFNVTGFSEISSFSNARIYRIIDPLAFRGNNCFLIRTVRFDHRSYYIIRTNSFVRLILFKRVSFRPDRWLNYDAIRVYIKVCKRLCGSDCLDNGLFNERRGLLQKSQLAESTDCEWRQRVLTIYSSRYGFIVKFPPRGTNIPSPPRIVVAVGQRIYTIYVWPGDVAVTCRKNYTLTLI